MECPNMLSGSQLVAKGATKKVDGQLPEVGLKDVTPNGSWLEQKQIQSALEARKHLIAVERIEKSGSLSHAEWRDDLKLAEVTKQTGGHWQYYGHKRGKYLYLLPEETLFLMETNCLLLRHNDVTVSLQKAYPLCLTSMSITQYKVYASLSRLGYRVFRHKYIHSKKIEVKVETAADDTIQDCQIDESTAMSLEHPESDSNNADQINADYSDINKDKNMKVAENEPPDSDIVKSNVQNEDPIDKTTVNNRNEDLVMNEINVTTIDTNIDETKDNVVKDTTVNDDRDFVIVTPKLSLSNDTHINNTDNTSTRANIDTTETNIDLSEPKIEVNNSQDENIEVIVEDDTSRMNVDDNANEMTVTNNNEDRTIVSRQETIENSVAVSETINAVRLASVYSVDESGTVRAFKEGTPMETESEQNIESTTADVTACSEGTKDVSTNDAFSHHQAGLKYYDDKIKKLIERKSRQNITDSLTAMQDFYKAQTVTVNMPEEIYLPRNIFLHKTEYRLNLEVISTQNVSTMREETDSTDSVTSTAPFQDSNSHRLTDLPDNNFNIQQNMPRVSMYRYTRYPTSHHRPYNPRPNFMYRAMPNFYGIPRYYPHYVRQQFMVYNVNVPRPARPDRQEQIKKYHYDMIVNIAMRLRNGLALPSQTQALHSLINTYNKRYNTYIRMDQNFTIIGTPDSAPLQTIELDEDRVITIDEEPVRRTRDEPKRKKRRLNDSSTNYNSNIQKLKEMAVKLKELHAKDLAVSRHRRVFSNAIKTFNKCFNADVRLGDNFEIVDKTTVSVDTSSDSDAVVVEEKPKKRKKLRNPFSILKGIAKDVNIGASTSRVPVLRMLSLNVLNQNNDSMTVDNTPSTEALQSFYDARFTGDDFGGARVCSRFESQLDALVFHAEYLQDILNEYDSTYNDWGEIKLAILKDTRQSLEMEKRQVEALSNDFFTTESQLRPLLGPVCSDLKSALEQLAIIPTNRDVPDDTSLRIHFDVCNRDVHFKKSNPPKPSFRVVCYDETEPFPSPNAVAALQARCSDGVRTVFAFVGGTASISYLQITPTDLPVFIPNNDVM